VVLGWVVGDCIGLGAGVSGLAFAEGLTVAVEDPAAGADGVTVVNGASGVFVRAVTTDSAGGGVFVVNESGDGSAVLLLVLCQ
jgi:hypothetical protein